MKLRGLNQSGVCILKQFGHTWLCNNLNSNLQQTVMFVNEVFVSHTLVHFNTSDFNIL